MRCRAMPCGAVRCEIKVSEGAPAQPSSEEVEVERETGLDDLNKEVRALDTRGA